MKTAYIHDDIFLNHDTGTGHPERSARLSTAQQKMQEQSWYDQLIQLSVREVEDQWIDQVHKPGYANRIAGACNAGEKWIDTPDVAVSAESSRVAKLATGSLMSIADKVMAKQVDNGFALVRPPGHHAEYDAAMGFCLYNSVAITARYLQQEYGLERVLILDWDVHHGNGTQHTFEQDPSVMFISLHQFPHYPGSGDKSETGIGAGEGKTINCPMSPGLGDDAYKEAFDNIVIPQALKFDPDFVLVSAGFDGHQADPLGSINLQTDSYRWMTKSVMELADRCADGRLVSVLEGGYDLNALAESVVEHVGVLHHG